MLTLLSTVAMLSMSMTMMRRDIVVIARGRVDAASDIRALAQCATAALLLQTGMRCDTKLWLTLPDRDGLTMACDGADAQTLPVMGKTIKGILEAEDLESLILPSGWQVVCNDSLEQRLAALGCCAPSASSPLRQETERDQALLQGRLDALRASDDSPTPDINNRVAGSSAMPAAEGGLGVEDTTSPLDPDAAARSKMLLAGRLAAMRLKAEMEETPPLPSADSNKAQADGADESAATESRRLIVLDGRGVSPMLTSAALSRLGEGTSAGAVVLLTADASSYTDSEARCLDSYSSTLVSISPMPLLPSHTIVLAHAALDAEVVSGAQGES